MKLYCYDRTGYHVLEKLQKRGYLADDHEHDLKMPTEYSTDFLFDLHAFLEHICRRKKRPSYNIFSIHTFNGHKSIPMPIFIALPDIKKKN